MKYTEEELKNLRLKQEFFNSVYDTVSAAIDVTSKKYKYKRYDIFKLAATIYSGEYGYITNKNDYRDEVKLLDEYFRKNYNHSIMTFEIIKALKEIRASKAFDILTTDIAYIEVIIRTGKEKAPSNPKYFAEYIDNEEYEPLMKKIEEENSLRYAAMLVYDRLKTLKKN